MGSQAGFVLYILFGWWPVPGTELHRPLLAIYPDVMGLSELLPCCSAQKEKIGLQKRRLLMFFCLF